MPPADNTPNFDAMTPEEIMAWMESLAKRQGASAEEFTTAADMQIAEIDPDSVVIDEPGYVPSEGKMKGQKIPSKTSFSQPAAVESPQPEPEPQPIEEILPPSEPEPVFAQMDEPEPAANASTLSWLESLAADQGMEFPDLSSLGNELAPATAEPSTGVNPVNWLESLAESDTEETIVPTPEPATSGDPMAWLESLAKRQGASEEELTTEANLDIPLPETWTEDGPGYTDYAFDTPSFQPKSPSPDQPASISQSQPELESSGLEDPAAWLDSLASSQGVEATVPAAEVQAASDGMSDTEIQAALARGEVVPHDQMEAWMSRQLEIGAERPEPEELSAYDPDAPAVPAELPDWLLDQVGTAPPTEDTPKAPANQPPLSDLLVEPPAVADMPDWLKEEPEITDLDSIFASTTEAAESVLPPPEQENLPPAPAATLNLEIDRNDPWVEAFDEEYERGQADITQTPEWYERNTKDPTRLAAVERIAGHEVPAMELPDANLPIEAELPQGEPEAVPDWLQELSSGEGEAIPADIPDWLQQDVEEPAAVPAVASEVPDWLQSVDVEATDIPDWLMDTLGTATSEQAAVVASQPPPITTTVQAVPAVIPAAPQPGYSPAPVPLQAAQIDAQATLNEARAKANVNDIDASLRSYEILIRANAELEATVADLGKLVEKFKTTPAIYRVLGDGLMRQGKLQLALDTYRKALNQL